MNTNILNLIDFEKVNKLLEGFNQSTGFVTAILDLEGNVLSKSGWRRICTGFHRHNPETLKKCTISDTVLAQELARGEKYHFYKCLNGLVDVAVPIVINNEHIANLFSGQFFFEEPDPAFFENQATTYGFDKSEYMSALKDVPVVSKEKVKVAMDFLLNMTQLISEITFQKLEQQQLNEALIKSEERSRTALDQMLEGCQIIGFDWRYIYMNRSAEVHNRRAKDELIGKHYEEMWPGIEETEVYKTIKQTLETRVPSHFENEFIFPDGSGGWFDLSIQPVPEGVFILSIDITERKKIENALRESEEKYRLISDNSDDWIYWIAPDGHMHYVSPSCERVTGYSPAEFAYNPELVHQIVFEADKKKVSNHTEIAKQDTTPHDLEFRILTKEGEIRWLRHSCSPIFGNNGEYLGRRVTNRNITERKLQEEQLFESEFRFNKLYENGPFGMVMADKDFRFKKANAAFCALLGYSEEELTKITFKDITHPDDQKKDLLNVKKLNNNDIPVYKTEKRYIHKEGHDVWGSLTATATYDSEGHFLYNLGIIEDITHRKQVEEELKKSKKLLSETESIGKVGGWEFNIDTKKQTWTEEVYRIHEVDLDFNPNVNTGISFYTPESRPIIENAVQRAIETGESFNLELEIISSKGNLRKVHTIGKPDKENRRVYGFFQDITERKKLEAKIHEKDKEFRKLSANVPDLIYQFTRRPDGTYYVPIASEGIRNIFGCAPQDVIDDFSPIGKVIHPDDAVRVISDIEYSAKHLTYFTCEFRVQIPGKEIQWIYSKSTPERLPDGSITWYGFNTDITQHKLAEKEIKLLNERIVTATRASQVGIWDWDIHNNILTWDDQMYSLYGLKKDAFNGAFETWVNGLHPDDQEYSQAETRLALAGEKEYDTEFRVIWPDGSVHFLMAKGEVFRNETGEPVRMVGVNYDITDRKTTEEEIRKLNESLEVRVEERTAQLIEANKELEAFSYSVSHDLRAPLRHINGFVDLLKEDFNDLLPEKGKHYLDVIFHSSRDMGTLIDDLLQFSRTGRQEMRVYNMDMNAVLKEVLTFFANEIENRRIGLIIATLPEVEADHSLLRMVWQNLISNAVKFTKDKEKASIQIGFSENENEYVFFVKDNGAGFDMRYAHKLFGVFQRLHSKQEFEGTGIGLANVRRIIMKHGGRTWAESVVDEGATFYFTIPKPKL